MFLPAACNAAHSSSDTHPIAHARATRRWSRTIRSFGESRPQSPPLTANPILVEFWSNPRRSVDRDLVGLGQNALKIRAFPGDEVLFLRTWGPPGSRLFPCSTLFRL